MKALICLTLICVILTQAALTQRNLQILRTEDRNFSPNPPPSVNDPQRPPLLDQNRSNNPNRTEDDFERPYSNLTEPYFNRTHLNETDPYYNRTHLNETDFNRTRLSDNQLRPSGTQTPPIYQGETAPPQRDPSQTYPTPPPRRSHRERVADQIHQQTQPDRNRTELSVIVERNPTYDHPQYSRPTHDRRVDPRGEYDHLALHVNDTYHLNQTQRHQGGRTETHVATGSGSGELKGSKGDGNSRPTFTCANDVDCSAYFPNAAMFNVLIVCDPTTLTCVRSL